MRQYVLPESWIDCCDVNGRAVLFSSPRMFIDVICTTNFRSGGVVTILTP
jgi:hypothetical protein